MRLCIFKYIINKVSLVLTLLLLAVFFEIAAQTVELKDSVFIAKLKEQYPDVIDASNRLIIAKAKLVTGNINIPKAGLFNVSGIEYFTNITSLNLSTNKLTSLPDISGLTKLEYLFCDNNELSALPSLNKMKDLKQLHIWKNKFRQIPDLSNLFSLEYIVASNNQIESLPDLSKFPMLKGVNVDYNMLTSIGNLPSITSLTSVIINNNRLSFKELEPLTLHPAYGSFTVFPQDSIGLKQKVQMFSSKPKALYVHAVNNAANYTFDWYKNGIYLKTVTGVDSLYFTNILPSDTGVYSCIVKCISTTSPFYNKSITTQTVSLSIGVCKTFSSINYNVINIDCKLGTDIEIEESFDLGAFGPYKYILTNSLTNAVVTYTSPQIKYLKQGDYKLKIEDIYQYCAVEIPDPIYINEIPDCGSTTNTNTTSFSPDGDGINETFFIEKEGFAEIFDRKGNLVKKISVPAYWDGTDLSGKLLDLGYYVIVVNGNSKMYVMLLQ